MKQKKNVGIWTFLPARGCTSSVIFQKAWSNLFDFFFLFSLFIIIIIKIHVKNDEGVFENIKIVPAWTNKKKYIFFNLIIW